MPARFSPVVLVPAFDAEATVGDVVRGLRAAAVTARSSSWTTGRPTARAPRPRRPALSVLRAARERRARARRIRAGLAALLATDATHVAFVDADGQHDPRDLPALLAAARAGEDFVIGSRMAEPGAIPAYRYRTNEIGSRILSRMTGLEVEDAQSGFRVVSADVLRRLRLNARGYIIETEILLKSARHVARFCHVPVRAIYGGPSHYKPFRDTWIISWGAVYYKVFEVD